MRRMNGLRGRMAITRVAAVGGLALLLGACGGGGGGQLTHQELVSKAGQVCTAAIAKGKSLDPQSPNYIQDALNQAKQLLQDLQALHPSAADASSYDEMTGALQKAIDDVGSGNFGDAAKQQTTYVAAATKLGLTACLQAGVAG